MYSLVAHIAAGSPNGNTFTTTGINTTGADIIVIGISDNVGGSTLSDSSGNTWTPLSPSTGTSGVSTLYYCQSPTTSPSHTFTLTATSNFMSIYVTAFSGSLAAPLDQSNRANSGFTTTIQPGSVTPSQNNELIVTHVCKGIDTSSFSINSGFSIIDSVTGVGSTHYGGAIAYLVQSTAAAVNPTWTSAQITGATIGSFKAAPTVAGGHSLPALGVGA